MKSSGKRKKSTTKRRVPIAYKTQKNETYFNKSVAVPSSAQIPLNNSNSSGWAYLLLISFILMVAGILSLPNFHSFLAPESLLAHIFVFPFLFFVGFIGMFLVFRYLPEDSARSEMPRWQAYIWFGFFFALCAFSRLYQLGEPPPNFWGDIAYPVRDDLGVIENFGRPLLFNFGSREPFYPYLTVALWELFPTATGIWVERLSSAIIDFGSIWGLYLLGSAIRGRRMGLILMAFWACSMPMTIWCYFIMGTDSAVLACVWVMLFFFRLIQKPSFPRFMYWGLAVAFGAITYAPFRPWAPAMITAVLFWILFGSKEKPKGVSPWILAIGFWFFWIFLFFYRNNFLPSDNHWISVAVSPPFIAIVVLGLLSTYFKTLFEVGKSTANRKIFGWATASILITLLMLPLLFNPLYAAHTSSMSVFHVGSKLAAINMATIKTVWNQIILFFGMMFYVNKTALPDYPLAWHSYFESFPVLAMGLGLAYFSSRPSWLKTFVISLMFVGMVPFILSNLQHSGRVAAAVAPLFLIGAWGLDYFWGLFRREMKSILMRRILFLLIFGFWALDAYWSFEACRQWMANKSCDALLLQQLEKEDWKKNRVIIAQHYPQLISSSTTVICDQKEVYQLEDPNPIYLEPGEEGKDVVLLIYGYDADMENRIKKDFPKAQWSVITIPDPDHPNFMKRALIPFGDLSETKDKLIYIQRVPHEYWRRRFYAKDYGVARGLIWWDERVPSLSSPLPQAVDPLTTVRVDGEVTVPMTGSYSFISDLFTCAIRLTIDGKVVIDLKPQRNHPLQDKEKVYLTAGTHRVSYETFAFALTSLKIHEILPDGGKELILGEAIPEH